jgi:hypothetical protein
MKKHLPLRSNYSLLLFFALSLTTALLFTACKDKDNNGEGDPPRSQEFKANCVTLTYQQIKAWADSGWLKPGSPDRTNILVLQFFSRNATNAESNLQLIGYPGNSPINVKQSGEVRLNIDTTCKTEPLKGEVIFSNNITNLDKLNIFEKDGSLRKFDLLRFTPVQDPKMAPYVTYKIEVIIEGRVDEQSGGDTWPCPPKCND